MTDSLLVIACIGMISGWITGASAVAWGALSVPLLILVGVEPLTAISSSLGASVLLSCRYQAIDTGTCHEDGIIKFSSNNLVDQPFRLKVRLVLDFNADGRGHVWDPTELRDQLGLLRGSPAPRDRHR